MKKTLLACVVSFIAVTAYPQKEVNALYPPELLIENLCPVDSMYAAVTEDFLLKGRYFSITDYTNGRLPYILTAMAADPNISTYTSESITDFYPYDIATYRKADPESLFKAFGGDTLIAISNDEEIKLIKEVDTLEMKAVCFIETWLLDTVRPAFIKSVKALVPVRSYTDPHTGKDILRRTCIIAQDKPSIKENASTLIARVRYEVPLYDQIDESEGFLPSEELYNRELMFSPFLSSYSRRMLTGFLERSALNKRVRCYDFYTGETVTDADSLQRGFGYNPVVTSFYSDTGESYDTVFIERTKYINSIVFCEEWYLDSTTQQFTKKVTGIAPVLWDMAENKKTVMIVVDLPQ